ncbi:hypothetical protein ACQ4PT_055682 [Festuca glaucescens]
MQMCAGGDILVGARVGLFAIRPAAWRFVLLEAEPEPEADMVLRQGELSGGLPSGGWHVKDVTLFTMHDLVHDLATVILGDQLTNKGGAAGKRCRYALLTDCSKPLHLSVISPENIKALYFLDCGELELRGDAFSLAKCLHILDLSECIIRKLPDSVGHLKQLRFLRAPRIQDLTLPNSIVELSELNYINLGGSCLLALPESIGDMKGLMHLDLSGCILLREHPASFAELKQLVHLDLSNCHMSISEAFGGFTKLQFLNLSIMQFVRDVNRKGLTRVMSNLIRLRYLNLSGCMKTMVPSTEKQFVELLDSISTLSNLEYLDLSQNVELTIIPESICNLRKLHTLDLSGCYSLHILPYSMVNMVSLKVLNVTGCSLLKKSLMNSQLNIVSLPHFVVRASTDTCSSNIILLRHTNPVDLAIDKLEYVKTAEEAQSIKLIEKKNIRSLTFQWTEDIGRIVDDKDVLEKLVPPSSVQTLNIDGYGSASIPYWLMGITQYLPNLSQINLWNFHECNNLPPLGQLPNLQGLNLCRMASLEEWNTAYASGKEGANELFFPKLEMLSIMHCAKLRIKPCLPKVKSLRIIDCDVLISSWGQSSSHSGASSSSPLTGLLVGKRKVPLHQWRFPHEVPVLRNLIISDCSDLTASPEIIKHLSCLRSLTLELLNQAELPSWLVELTSLQRLHLIHCNSMTSLPQWFGELTSLKIIEVKYCKGIRSLPDSIQQLAKLERLDINGCPALVKWCESEDNKMKLAHITTKVCACQAICGIVLILFFPSWDNEEDDLCSAVMNMPAFTEEALIVVVAHLRDNKAQGSAYMGLDEEDRLLWVLNFLSDQNQIDSFVVVSEDG